jgi:hypothetical protein
MNGLAGVNKSTQSMNNGVEELEATFADCGYVFRHFEDCTVPYMTWQAGRLVAVECSCNGKCWLDEAFQLVAWASTSEALIDKLSALD